MNEPVPRHSLVELTPGVAKAYAGETNKALSRDLDFLIKEGLIRRKNGGFISSKKKMLAFRPLRKKLPASPASAG